MHWPFISWLSLAYIAANWATNCCGLVVFLSCFVLCRIDFFVLLFLTLYWNIGFRPIETRVSEDWFQLWQLTHYIKSWSTHQEQQKTKKQKTKGFFFFFGKQKVIKIAWTLFQLTGRQHPVVWSFTCFVLGVTSTATASRFASRKSWQSSADWSYYGTDKKLHRQKKIYKPQILKNLFLHFHRVMFL